MYKAYEVSFAGGLIVRNPNIYYYLNSSGGSSVGNNTWWTMSPERTVSESWSFVFAVIGSDNPGYLNAGSAGLPYAVRPVLSLKSCVSWESGNGTPSNPYKVSVSSTCSSAAN